MTGVLGASCHQHNHFAFGPEETFQIGLDPSHLKVQVPQLALNHNDLEGMVAAAVIIERHHTPHVAGVLQGDRLHAPGQQPTTIGAVDGVAQRRRANVYAEDVGSEDARHAVLFARPEVQGGSESEQGQGREAEQAAAARAQAGRGRTSGRSEADRDARPR